MVIDEKRNPNQARERRVADTRTKLAALIRRDTGQAVEPDKIQTTKPSDGVPWEFVSNSQDFPRIPLGGLSA
ncbi:hypothetical protein BDZ91DRAFT_801187 [Kalaharituber pfeilii]|nr:hypothetical protein BDZ91DRAFT_801187 [Kalaharituber pfeilii]